MKSPRALSAAILFGTLSLALVVGGCASTRGGGAQRIEPGGSSVELDSGAFKLLKIQDEFVLMRFREPGSSTGGISGFVEEVFRISRSELGAGKWYVNPSLPGVYLQWLGLDSFALAEDPPVAEGAEVVTVK